MTTIRDIRSHTFMKDDRLLIDTNVWLSVYGPIPYRRKRAVLYSNAIANIKRIRCMVFIDVIVVSEFINKYARLEFQQTGNEFNDFKAFRDSAYFKPVARNIATSVMGIMNNCTRCGTGFHEMNISSLLADFAGGNKDFNDQVIVEICKTQGLQLLTDDGDFHIPDVHVITANNQLLAAITS